VMQNARRIRMCAQSDSGGMDGFAESLSSRVSLLAIIGVSVFVWL
jgi:hypothetical protein